LPYRYIFNPLGKYPDDLTYSDLYSIQTSLNDKTKFYFTNFESGLTHFDKFPERSIIFSHNLAFDLSALLGNLYLKFLENPLQLKLIGNSFISGFIYDKVMCFARFKFWAYDLDENLCPKINKKGGLKRKITKILWFIDIANWYGKRKLETIAKEEFPNEPSLWKMEKPDYLGKRLPEKNELDYFIQYAIQDARICEFLGRKILKNQSDYNIKLSPTPGGLGSNVLRKAFLKKYIPYFPLSQLRFIWQTYNGARFESFGRGTFRGINIYDFNSLYPYSACFPIPIDRYSLESFTLDEFENNVDIIGFIHSDFEFQDNTLYPCLPVRDKRLYFPLSGKTFCTSYEFRLGLEMGMNVNSFRCLGFVPTEKEIDHPLKDFMKEFYKEKMAYDKQIRELETENKDIPITLKEKRNTVKLILNSTYGKFAERHKIIEDGVEKWVAGKLFNPPICSLICGKSREILSRAIIKYQSIFSDTDSIVTFKKLDKKDDSLEMGKFKSEMDNGIITIIKPKQYYAFNPATLKEKIAYHSFRKPEHFINLIKNPSSDSLIYKYHLERFLKAKEANRRGLLPRAIITQPFKISLGADTKRIYDKDFKTLNELLTENTYSRPLKSVSEFE